MNVRKQMNSGIIEYQMGEANLPLKGNPLDADNFYPADGVEDADQGFYSEIFGLSKAERDARNKRKDLRVKSKAEARTTKADAKKGSADAQVESAKALGKDTSAADIAMAKALGGDKKKDDKKDNSMLIYGGIALVVVGLGIFAWVKLRKKK